MPFTIDGASIAIDRLPAVGGPRHTASFLAPLKPKAYLPVHWDSYWGAFQAGVPHPYSDPRLEAFLAKSGVKLLKPNQYMDKWRLDRNGVRSLQNDAVKESLGFSNSHR